MKSNIISKFIYFWIFILGGIFVAWIMGFLKDNTRFIIFIVAIALVYVVFQVARALGQRKRGGADYAAQSSMNRGSRPAGAKKNSKKRR